MAVGDTLLGDLGIALCSEQGGAPLQLHLDAASGNLSLAQYGAFLPLDGIAHRLHS